VLLVVAALAAACAVGVARVGARAIDGAQAQTAADAAALAGVIHGRRGADALAARNGARVVSWRPASAAVEEAPPTVTVTVVLVGDPSVTATARATVEP
jgi:hypothetical protein